MLSVLIPTYNYDVSSLIKSLHQQLQEAAIEFEIICFDDGSKSDRSKKNQALNKLENTTYQELEENIGLAGNRNALAHHAKYPWLLFLDSDLTITSRSFIQRYLNDVDSSFDVINGGLSYQEQTPPVDQRLRWTYGRLIEGKMAPARNDLGFKHMLCSNFMIRKAVFETVSFDATLTTYGYEDAVFAFDLQQANFSIQHIENPAQHDRIETSRDFLQKTSEALQNLHKLYHNQRIQPSFVRLLAVYEKVDRMKLKGLLSTAYKLFKNLLEQQLCSGRPSLRIFNWYKLLYFCHLNR